MSFSAPGYTGRDQPHGPLFVRGAAPLLALANVREQLQANFGEPVYFQAVA